MFVTTVTGVTPLVFMRFDHGQGGMFVTVESERIKGAIK